MPRKSSFSESRTLTASAAAGDATTLDDTAIGRAKTGTTSLI